LSGTIGSKLVAMFAFPGSAAFLAINAGFALLPIVVRQKNCLGAASKLMLCFETLSACGDCGVSCKDPKGR